MDSYDLDLDIDAGEFFVVTLNRKTQIEGKSNTNQRKKWILNKLEEEGKI